MNAASSWLEATQGDAPLVVSIPHSGTDIPDGLEERFVSSWLARKDADWWVHRLYDFAPALGATIVRTSVSRSVIDVNRDPSGRSLYPGQNTTELCPTTTFDGEPLYRDGQTPDAEDIARRRELYFAPYHAALAAEIARLRERHRRVVLFEAHSIRSRIPRIFDGELPNFNLGTNSGASCAAELTEAIEQICDSPFAPPPLAGEVRPEAGEGGSHETFKLAQHCPPPPLRGSSPASGRGSAAFTRVTNGRFKGGWTTRRYGEPDKGVHAVQLELAIRGYMDEPEPATRDNWPTAYNAERAAPMRAVLQRILETCISFASAL
jgi:formiminoglutamase